MIWQIFRVELADLVEAIGTNPASRRPVLENSPSRLWRAYFTRTIYVPEEGRYVLAVLESDGPHRFVEELERLSALGAPWASAMLGCIQLVPAPDGKRNTDSAIALCERPAAAGDVYALFVYAWALLFGRQANAAYSAMEKAAHQSFPPAVLALALFIWNGWGLAQRHPVLALRTLRLASQLGHSAGLLVRCAFYRSGSLGAFRRALGYLLAPFAAVHFWLALRRDPFSAGVFLFYARLSGPLLLPLPRLALATPDPDLTSAQRSQRLFNRALIAWTHAGLAFTAALVFLTRLPRIAPIPGREVLFLMALALAPYVISFSLARRFVTHKRMRLAIFAIVLLTCAVLVDALLLQFRSVAEVQLRPTVDEVILFEAFLVQALFYAAAADRILRI